MMETLSNLKAKAAKIKYFFSDVDGTLTDGGVYYSPSGELLKKFNLRDGTGYFLLKQVGIKTGIITTECSPIVQQRVNKLHIDEYIYGTNRKLESIQEFLNRKKLNLNEIAFIGDEINDVNLLKECGLSFAVNDAHERVKSVVDVVCINKGGHGAFREAVEFLLKLRNVDIEGLIDSQL